jgi:hypothetical protein
MNGYRYPLRRMLADYLLGGVGTAMSIGMVVLAHAVIYILVICGGLTAVFLLFTIRTALRHRLRIAADAMGLRVKGGPVRQLKWQELEHLTLRYYSTRRSRKDGWMTLKLTAGGRPLSIDSHLEGFEEIARLAAEAARARHLDLDATTRSNFAAMDIALPDPAR